MVPVHCCVIATSALAFSWQRHEECAWMLLGAKDMLRCERALAAGDMEAKSAEYRIRSGGRNLS